MQSNACEVFWPIESHSTARETILAGPYHNLVPRISAKIKTPKASREYGEVCPLTIQIWFWGSVVSSPDPSRGWGRRDRWILCMLEVSSERSYLDSRTPFSVFLSYSGLPNVPDTVNVLLNLTFSFVIPAFPQTEKPSGLHAPLICVT